MKKLFLLLFILNIFINAQTKDPNEILASIKGKFNKVKDYEVDVSVKLDFEMIKVPDTKAKIYFKQPNKIKVDSKGFAMLPKQSVNFSPAQYLEGDYTAIYVKTEIIDNKKQDILKIIPDSDSSDIILSTLWIDNTENVIRKIETTGKRSGTIQIHLKYESYKYGLPSEIRFEFNLGNVQLPETENQKKRDDEKQPRRGRQQVSGSVLISYSNYKVNTGIPDGFFDNKSK